MFALKAVLLTMSPVLIVLLIVVIYTAAFILGTIVLVTVAVFIVTLCFKRVKRRPIKRKDAFWSYRV
jgi:hypothetical protein